MKYLTFLIIIITTSLFQGCCCGPDSDKKYFNAASVQNILVDSNNSIHVILEETMNEKKHCLKQNINRHWKYIDMTNCIKLKSDENISYSLNKVIIKDKNNSVTFEDILPTILNVENITGISLPNNHFKYMPLKNRDYNQWDRKTNILVVGVNKEVDRYGHYYYSNIYYFSVVKDGENWLTNKIYETGRINSGIGLDNDNLYISYVPLYGAYSLFNDNIPNHNGLHSVGAQMILGALPFNATETENIVLEEYKYIVKDNNGITVKSLFPDIYPLELAETLRFINDESHKYETVPFYENNLMHVFYTSDSMKGEYFKYELYSKENPTVPQYEQKIAWE